MILSVSPGGKEKEDNGDKETPPFFAFWEVKFTRRIRILIPRKALENWTRIAVADPGRLSRLRSACAFFAEALLQNTSEI